MGERARGVALDVSRAAITEQGTWGAATGPVVQFNAPDMPHVRFSDLTAIRTSAVMCTWLSETGTPKAKSTSAGSVSAP